MEHKNLTMETDKNLINSLLDNNDMRYVLLFLYITRNDLFEDFNNEEALKSYESVIILDEIYKSNVLSKWEENFLNIVIDLGLFKNIRSIREFKQKTPDFILKMGEKTITIEDNTILVPEETLFLIIKKKFKNITKRNFNLALTRLRGVRCEGTGIIHSFIYQIGEDDYSISDDLYYILDQFGNIYQAIKMEVTIEGFQKRFKEIQDKIHENINYFDQSLNSKTAIKKASIAIENDKDIIEFLKEEKIKLGDKFQTDKIDRKASIYIHWNTELLQLLNIRFKMNLIEEKLNILRNYYSGKKKVNNYLDFIEKVSFNEDDIVNKIQDSLIALRKEIVDINENLSKMTKKELKLLNLDYERFLITSGDD